MAGAASATGGEEWELCNDDGFIYKRRKRDQPDEGLPLASCSAQPPAADHEAELKRNRLARTKLSLVALRDRYRREMEQWEALVASLLDGGGGGSDGGGGRDLLHPAVEEATGQHGAAAGAVSTAESDEIAAPENPFYSLMEELVLQVEAQESILKKLSDICDIVDSACDVREEAIIESLLDLPVWGSPRTLMSSLLE